MRHIVDKITQEGDFTIYSSYELCHSTHTPLYSRLREYIIVLNAIKEARETPERIGLDCIQYVSG